MNPSRYHPALVALHWLLAALVVAALVLGTFVMKKIPNSSPEKLEALRAHMAGGIAILALMAVRFVVRMSSARPVPAKTGSSVLDKLALLNHYGFYVLIAAMAGTGLATAILAGLPSILFGGSGAALPESFAVFPTRVAHGLIAKLLITIMAVHALAALYHQFIRRDGLLGRMWFGSRWPTRAYLRNPN